MNVGSKIGYTKTDGRGLARNDEWEFIDFGCGAGKSVAFANAVVKGSGLGIDKSEKAVAECRAQGYDAQVGDILAYERRNVAAATFAIDLMPELASRAQFETACVNLVRAARNFSVIQHPYFDTDAVLAPLGLYCEENFARKLKFRPLLADYILFARSHAAVINIVGLAVFGFGEAVVRPIFDGPAAPVPPGFALARTLRVVIGRKDTKRFNAALRKVAIGQTLFVWTQENGA